MMSSLFIWFVTPLRLLQNTTTCLLFQLVCWLCTVHLRLKRQINTKNTDNVATWNRQESFFSFHVLYISHSFVVFLTNSFSFVWIVLYSNISVLSIVSRMFTVSSSSKPPLHSSHAQTDYLSAFQRKRQAKEPSSHRQTSPQSASFSVGWFFATIGDAFQRAGRDLRHSLTQKNHWRTFFSLLSLYIALILVFLF